MWVCDGGECVEFVGEDEEDLRYSCFPGAGVLRCWDIVHWNKSEVYTSVL